MSLIFMLKTYIQSMFLIKNKKTVYPCKPQFNYIKVGFKGILFHGYVFQMLSGTLFMFSRCFKWYFIYVDKNMLPIADLAALIV